MIKDKLKHVKISEISVGDRFRIDMKDLDTLAASINEKGILQPITLSSKMELLAGGRRLAAAKQLGLDTIPALIREIEDEIDLREIELIENIHRQDFSWDEEVMLVRRIDELYREKNYKWNTRKTAALLDISIGGVSEAIKMANAIDVVPDILNCKTRSEASKFLKKVEEDFITAELIKRQKSEYASAATNDWALADTDNESDDQSPQIIPPQSVHPEAFPKIDEQDRQSFVRNGIAAALKLADSDYRIGDVFKGMATMRTQGRIGFIECDPPYGIDLGNTRMKAAGVNAVNSYEEIDKTSYEEFLRKLTNELYRIAGKDCWMIFWFGPTWQHEVLTNLRAAGWLVDEIPALWIKPSGQTMQPDLYFARCYEPFYVCRKGNPVMALRGQPNYFGPDDYALKEPYEVERYHPTQRSKHLIKDIMRRLLPTRTYVFVPFLGSGATLRTCYDDGHRGFGYDINSEYKPKFLLAVERDARIHLGARSYFGTEQDPHRIPLPEAE